MFQTNVVEKIKTPIVCTVTFFTESHAICEITSKIMVEPDRTQMTIHILRRMPFACSITKVRMQTLAVKFNTYCFYTLKMVIRSRRSVGLY